MGGYIAQTLAWRWYTDSPTETLTWIAILMKMIRSFFSQVPVVLIAIILVAWRLDVPKREGHIEESHWEKLKRVDFIGSAFLSGSIVALLLALNLFSSAKAWSNSGPILSLLIGAILIVTFCLVEKYWAKEPIFPLELLARRDTCLSYLILGCQLAAQLAVSSKHSPSPSPSCVVGRAKHCMDR